MRISGSWLRRQIAGCLVLVMCVPFAAAATSPQQETNSSQQAGEVRAAQAPSNTLDSGDTTGNAQTSAETFPDSPGAVLSQTIDGNRPPSSGQQSSPKQQQNAAPEPVGTAAAQPLDAVGVAASKPAGAAIAPAKQKRSRSILIKVSALLGAGVAVGTVVALSNSSPSRPSVSR